MSKKNEGMLYVPCDRELQGEFLKFCSELKVRYEQAVVEAIEEWMERRRGQVSDPYIQLMLEERFTDNWYDAENRLIRLVIKWGENMNEEQIEILEKHCANFGFNPQKIIDSAKADKNVQDYVKQHGSLTKVQQWLVDLMPRSHEGIPASYIIDKCCKSCGVKKPTVYAAKRALKIVSQKDGGGGQWKWYWPGYENEPTQEELDAEELDHMKMIHQSFISVNGEETNNGNVSAIQNE